MKAEHSHAYKDKEEENAAKYAIDLDLETSSVTTRGPDGKSWLKITLDHVYCVEQVLWIKKNGSPYITWTCSPTDCSVCDGSHWCSDYSVTVSTEGKTPSNLRPVPGCRHGDTVMLHRKSGHEFYGYEVAITGNQGEHRVLELCMKLINYQVWNDFQLATIIIVDSCACGPLLLWTVICRIKSFWPFLNTEIKIVDSMNLCSLMIRWNIS